MEDGAGGAAFKAAPRTVIKFVDGDFGGQSHINRYPPLARGQGGLEVTDAFFHAAVVAGKVRWIQQVSGGRLFARPAAKPIQQQKCADKKRKHAIESIACRMRMPVNRHKDRVAEYRRKQTGNSSRN